MSDQLRRRPSRLPRSECIDNPGLTLRQVGSSQHDFEFWKVNYEIRYCHPGRLL